MPVTFLITYRMLTGSGRLEADSHSAVLDIVADLRRAGASNITVVDEDGKLITFEAGDAPVAIGKKVQSDYR